MRVVAGEARGRPLTAPAGRSTRPTSDRVREAVFNALFSLGDVVAGARVLDLFAGSGALGIEALSRGAGEAVFVERDRRACRAIEANLAATGLSGAGRVVQADALSWVRNQPVAVELALCDPPYGFDSWPTLLAHLDASLAVIESDRPLQPGSAWEVLRSRRYSGTVVSIIRRRDPGVTLQESVH